jgi:glyoxylase-like metal-dependent hydrolase (beta-lactamase superfamily II)
VTIDDAAGVIAVRYGVMESSRARQFYRYDAYREPDGPITLDYFFWAIPRREGTILIDSGYHPDAIARRPGRVCLIPPTEALASVGIDPDQVSLVVVTHFHFDHIGNLAAFPNARYLVQRKELEYWTGPHGQRQAVASSVEEKEIRFIVDAEQAGRVDLIDGDCQVADGIWARLVGGHCPGQQVVTVGHDRPLVLCSDALHFREEMERYMPFNVLFDVAQMYRAYDLFNELAAAGATIVPGHDPAVMADFAPVEGAGGLAVRLR